MGGESACRFELTDEQRPYFGLKVVDPSWERVEIGDQEIFYFAGSRLKKALWLGDGSAPGYEERDEDLQVSEDRRLILPKTKRGKPKKLAWSTLERMRPDGFCFWARFGISPRCHASHPRKRRKLVGSGEVIHSTADLRAWVDDYVRRAGPEQLEEVESILGSKRRRVRYRCGDVFLVPLPDGTHGGGRVLLDVHRLRAAGALETSPIEGSGLLVELFAVRLDEEPDVEALRDAPRLPSLYLSHAPIYRGELPLVGNLPVTAAEIDFPESVSGTPLRPSFSKGGLRAPLAPMSDDAYMALPHGTLALGVTPARLAASLDRGEAYGRSRDDLRGHPARDGVLAQLGVSPHDRYDHVAAALGGPTAAELLAASAALE